MADDREVLREVWEGRIPVAFHLAKDEVASEQPDPFYVSMIAAMPKNVCLPSSDWPLLSSDSKHFYLFTFFFFHFSLFWRFLPPLEINIFVLKTFQKVYVENSKDICKLHHVNVSDAAIWRECSNLRGYCTSGPYFGRLCAFSQKIKQLWTKYPMNLVWNVPRNSKITVLLQ